MDPIELRTHIADDSVASSLAALIGRLEDAFPGSITGYYLFGSQVDASAVTGSDIDLCLVARSGCGNDRQRAIANACLRLGPELGLLALDPVVMDEGMLRASGHFRVKACSVFLWGTDIRGFMPVVPIADYLRSYVHAPVAYMAGVLRQTDRIVSPVTWPDPDDEFFGYSRLALPPRNVQAPNVKAYVATACWIASAIVSLRTGVTVCTRAEAVRLHRHHIGDAWSAYVDEVYRFGNQELGYLLPAGTEDRRRLRRLCREMPGLENHFLEHYRDYLLGELGEVSGAARLLALQRLAEVIYRDGSVTAAIARHRDHGDAAIMAAAGAALDANERA